MDTFRILRQSIPRSEFDAVWCGDTFPDTKTIDALCANERIRANEHVRSPFTQRRNDYLLLQRRRKVIGWRTVNLVNIYDGWQDEAATVLL